MLVRSRTIERLPLVAIVGDARDATSDPNYGAIGISRARRLGGAAER